jgi:hypothetical protein
VRNFLLQGESYAVTFRTCQDPPRYSSRRSDVFQETWQFAGLVDVTAVLISYDPAADVLTYAPDPDRFGTRQIKRRSFEQGYYKLP